jgi:hypothetical protein
MRQDLHVSSWVAVRHGCPIAYCVKADEVEFRLGSAQDGFDFVFELSALQAFVDAAQAAITESGERG